MDGWIDQTDGKADRQVAREKDKMTERQADRQLDIYTDRRDTNT